jgi:uncharacterized membrane protein YqjE
VAEIDVRGRADGATTPIGGDASIGELLGRVTDDFSSLVRTHVELAKVEIKEEVTKAGNGAGMFAGAGVAGVLTLSLLSVAAAWGLAEVMPEGVAFLIVGALWGLVAAVLALRGKAELKAVNAPPPQTKQTIQEDVQWAKQQTS